MPIVSIVEVSMPRILKYGPYSRVKRRCRRPITYEDRKPTYGGWRGCAENPQCIRWRTCCGLCGAAHTRVTFVELFFDLVFVFAVTQLSHTLVEHLTLIGALQTLFLLLAVWWVWMYTCWFTNWVDPDRPPVRTLMFVLMLAGLLLSASLPHAFDGEALLFASAYVFSQLVRSAFMLWATHGHDHLNFNNFRRIISWQIVAAVFWLAGGFCVGATRVILWVTALGIECVGPYAGFFVPGLGRSGTTDWRIDGAHMAERSALFVIIALGESILVTGTTAAAQPATAANICAFLVAFVGSVAMWWIYFNIGAERGSHQIAHSADPGRVARAVYTYFHIPIVAGHRGVRGGRRNHHQAPGRPHGFDRGGNIVRWPGALPGGQPLVQTRQRQILPALAPRGPRVAVAADARRHVHDATRARRGDHGGAGDRRRLGDAVLRKKGGHSYFSKIGMSLFMAGEIRDGADQRLCLHGLGEMRLESGGERVGTILHT